MKGLSTQISKLKAKTSSSSASKESKKDKKSKKNGDLEEDEKSEGGKKLSQQPAVFANLSKMKLPTDLPKLEEKDLADLPSTTPPKQVEVEYKKETFTNPFKKKPPTELPKLGAPVVLGTAHLKQEEIEHKAEPQGEHSEKRIPGPHDGDPMNVDALKKWIVEVKDLIKAGQYEAAYAKLNNHKDVHDRFGITIIKAEDKVERHTNPTEQLVNYAKNNRAVGSNMTVKLGFPPDEIELPESLDKKGNLILKAYKWLEMPKAAERVLLMALEEYMHIAQAKSNSYFSNSTAEYKAVAKNDNHDKSNQDKAGTTDYDEIDIMAQLADWKFNVTDEDGETVKNEYGIPERKHREDYISYMNNYKYRDEYSKWREKRRKESNLSK